jgi:Fe-S-cluster containining protein
MPEDFGAGTDAFESRIKSALASGRWAIDWWEGDPRSRKQRKGWRRVQQAYYLRPATRSNEGELFDPSRGGRCTFHKDHGCSIFPSRPSGCRGLAPRPEPERMFHGCRVIHSSKQDAAIAWIPFTETLLRAADRAQETP